MLGQDLVAVFASAALAITGTVQAAHEDSANSFHALNYSVNLQQLSFLARSNPSGFMHGH